MIDMEFILDVTPKVFAMAMLMDIVNSVLLPIGKKDILKTLCVISGNEKEQDEIRRAIRRIFCRYLPIFLFISVSILEMNFSLDMRQTRIAHLFLTIWAMIASRNYLGFNIYNLAHF